MAAEQKHCSFPQGFALWFCDPWMSFNASVMPKEQEIKTAESVVAYIGEKIPLALMVSNSANYSRGFRVTIGNRYDQMEPADLKTGELLPDKIALREVVFIEGRNDKQIRSSLPDALPLLNEAGVLQVGPYQTRQLWITVDTAGLKAGEYEFQIVVRALEDIQGRSAASRPVEMPSKTATVKVKVLPLAMPARPNLDVCVWEYDRWILGPSGPAIIGDITANGAANIMLLDVNSDGLTRGEDFGKILEPGWTPERINFKKMDKIIDLKKGPGRKFLVWNMAAWFDERVCKVNTEKGKKLCLQWIKACVDHLKQRGMGYDDFLVEIVDEVYKANVDNDYAVAKGLKELDPRIKIFQTVGGDTRFEDIKRMAPYVDVWCVWDCRIDKADELEFMKATGKPVWIYRCSLYAKVLSPIGYYRSLPLMAWKYGLNGCGMWSYDFGTGNLWDEFDTRGWNFGDSAIIYPGANGPILSKRWEGWRRGMDDYKALQLLSELIRNAKGRGGLHGPLCPRKRAFGSIGAGNSPSGSRLLLPGFSGKNPSSDRSTPRAGGSGFIAASGKDFKFL